MIKLENITKSFGDHIIFNNFSLEINKNEFVVFNGVSGCGKTTLLNMIGGIEPVNSGNIFVDGINVSSQKNLREFFAEHIGFLFQNFALVEHKTVKKNLEMIPRKHTSNISIQEALKKVGMEGKENQKVYQLSGGEQQRIALARLMIKKCSVILADEPTGSLDKENAKTVISILKQLHDEGKTIIMVTHDKTIIDDDMKVVEI